MEEVGGAGIVAISVPGLAGEVPGAMAQFVLDVGRLRVAVSRIESPHSAVDFPV